MTSMLTLADAVATHARLRPHKLGCRDSQRSLTFLQWQERSDRLAAGLLGLGLSKGERVAILATNSIEWMEIYVALARAGLVAVPMNFRLTGAELLYIAENAEVSAIIASKEFCATIDSIRDLLAIKKERFVAFGQHPPAGWAAYENLIAQADLDYQFGPVGEEDLCALMYTSGTTGRPKGAMRTHGGSSLIALATALEMGFSSNDTALLVMPLCHANSLYFGTTFIHLGATCIIEDRRSFDPEGLLATLARERVTFTSLVPTHYIMVLGLPEAIKLRYDVSAVAKLMISSAPARRDTKLAIMEYFKNSQLYELYGSTEAGWVTLLRPHEQLDHLGSVGREWAGSGAIRLLDEQGTEVTDGQVGELYSRTPYAFEGYWRNPDKTRQAIRGDWVSVGDLARRAPDGYIWLVDRKSNMIITGGENVYPSEVEGVLGAHPAVKDVAVIGIPHEKWGEAVHAVVVLHIAHQATAKDLIGWCRERLAGFKCPSDVRFISDAEMPRNATGKILHRALRQAIFEEAEAKVMVAPQ